MTDKTITNRNFDLDFKVKILHRIENGHEEQTPVVQDGVKWDTEREGACGKLSFKVYKDSNGLLNFQEGDIAQLWVTTEPNTEKLLFHGYIFTKKRDKDGWIDVTAYDQLRYLKNKATYVFKNRTASDIVKQIASDYLLEIGTIEDTNYVIGQRVEDDESLFDIIQNALDLTLIQTGKKYVLYDDAGKLCLQNVDNLKTDFILRDNVAENFDYTSSIDEETYNEVDLYYDNDETNKREFYRVHNKTSIENWGRLRYTDNLQDKTNVQERVKQLLHLYNRKTRELDVKNVFGDYRCRAGASVITQLLLGDIDVEEYMVIESATHTFKKDQYRMDLKLDIVSNEKYNSTDEIYDVESIQLKTTPKSPLATAINSTETTQKQDTYVSHNAIVNFKVSSSIPNVAAENMTVYIAYFQPNIDDLQQIEIPCTKPTSHKIEIDTLANLDTIGTRGGRISVVFVKPQAYKFECKVTSNKLNFRYDPDGYQLVDVGDIPKHYEIVHFSTVAKYGTINYGEKDRATINIEVT